jgi:hypothetical protein
LLKTVRFIVARTDVTLLLAELSAGSAVGNPRGGGERRSEGTGHRSHQNGWLVDGDRRLHSRRVP